MRKFLYIAALVSVLLACGVNTQLPYSQNTPKVVAVYLSPTPEPILNQYIVTAETLQYRDGAGEEFAPLGYLSQNEIVTCLDIAPALDGGLWCKHEKGYSNIRYMKGLK